MRYRTRRRIRRATSTILEALLLVALAYPALIILLAIGD